MSEVDRPLTDRVASVSGGSRGIGAATAQRLARRVVLVTTNYISEYTGHIAELDDTTATEVGMLRRQVPDSKVVKASAISMPPRCPSTAHLPAHRTDAH